MRNTTFSYENIEMKNNKKRISLRCKNKERNNTDFFVRKLTTITVIQLTLSKQAIFFHEFFFYLKVDELHI